MPIKYATCKTDWSNLLCPTHHAWTVREAIPAVTYRIARAAVPLVAPCKSTAAADRSVAVAVAVTASDR